ncbi:VCBS repeat-containing protein [Glycomyces sp. NPDC047010]|uniref:FG-GAP repeat domain-containing protein n=1 Tax=Glycomyces sp. NPDC047010 TaxID=3155023 RepID=UPI0033D4680E
MHTPHRRPHRTAALTAAAVVAALLAVPAAAAAQTTETDCAALGADPRAAGFEAALEIAVACDVEVRLDWRSSAYDSTFVTPDGRLHVVQTVEPVQPNLDGPADATLVEADGTLVQANSPAAFSFSGTAVDAALMATRAGGLDWIGDQPEPEVDGATVHYSGLADGLDLDIEARIAAAALRFTVDGPDAWSALSTGLTTTARVYDNGLFEAHERETGVPATWEESTPFTVRDAEGAAHTVALTGGVGAALTLGLDQAVVDGAAYPLTVTAEWAYHLYGVNEWGATTSAAPDLSVFRGDAGLDQPYFEAAGQDASAVVGGYCDALADPGCTADSTAAVYWNFWYRYLTGITPQGAPGLTYRQSSATFSVDAAAGSECTAPPLQYSEVYRASTTWANAPGLNPRPAVAGECLDGTAVYGLDSVYGHPSPVAATFAMTEAAETARFDGGSARLDVYYTVGDTYTVSANSCPAADRADSTVAYGKFTTDFWRPDLIDPSLTWTATITDDATGETVFTTGPAPVAEGVNPTATVEIQDGVFTLEHEITGPAGQSKTWSCALRIDTDAPDIIEIDVPEGPYYVGETVPIAVTIEDESYAYGSVRLWCSAWLNCWGGQDVTSGEPVEIRVQAVQTHTSVTVSATDDAGNRTVKTFTLTVTAPSNDYDVDGYQDLVTVRRADGSLMFHKGKGAGGFEAPVSLGSGWGPMDVVMAGDLTGDRHPDLLARDTRTGVMYTYPGDGEGGLEARIQVGTGWNLMADFTSATDFDGDGKIDLIAVSDRTDKLYLYPGLGNGRFAARSTIAENWLDEWSSWDNLTTVGICRDATPGLLFDWAPTTGDYRIYCADGDGGITYNRQLEDDLIPGYSDDGNRYVQIVGNGDYSGDGVGDLLAVDARTGTMVLRSYDAYPFVLEEAVTVGSGWAGYELPIGEDERSYDYYSDGNSDVLAWRKSTGEITHYHGTGAGFMGAAPFTSGLGSATLVETAGDINSDGANDVLVRFADGTLYAYPGTGQSYYETGRIKIGTGWNAMSAVVSGQDFNADGRVDVLAREQATGKLWLYPGTGAGKLGSRVQIGSGWEKLRDIVAAGDLDHDGRADLLAVRKSDNCLYRYDSTGTGTLQAGVKVGCGWAGLDALASVGDFDNDGHGDFVARRTSDGKLFLYKGDGKGGFTSAVAIGTGWNAIDIIA